MSERVLLRGPQRSDVQVLFWGDNTAENTQRCRGRWPECDEGQEGGSVSTSSLSVQGSPS